MIEDKDVARSLKAGSALLANLKKFDVPAERAALRDECVNLMARPTLTMRQRVEACLLLGETYLADQNYHGSHAACAQARAAAGEPVWVARTRMLLARTCLQERNTAGAQKELRLLVAMNGVEPQLKWEAESLLGAVALLPQIRTERPRLFFTSAMWPAIKERALSTEKVLFDQMQSHAKAIQRKDVRANNFAKQAMEAAFVFCATRDPALLEKVRHMLRVTVEDFPTRRDGGSERSYPAIAWSAALDWAWNDLSGTERQSLVEAMLRDACTRVAESKAEGQLAKWPHYYVRGMYWFVGLATLDNAADDVTYVRALSLIGIGLKHHRDRIASLLDTARDDGVWQTNLDYDFGSVPSPVFEFFHTWKPATGGDLPDEWRHAGISAELALRAIVGTGKDHVKYFNYAGHSGGCWGFGEMSPYLLYDYLGQHIHFFGKAHPDDAAIAYDIRHRMSTSGTGTSTGDLPVLRFLLTGLESRPSLELPKRLPVARHFNSIGLVLMSSGFGPDDTYALFSQGGGVAGRRHDYDATHFSIYKKGYLALDTGTRMAAGHSANYRHQTVAHNAILIRMPGERFPPSETGPVTSNAGGQNRDPANARVLAFETDRLFAYTAADATPVYNKEKCSRMTRQFLYLPPNHFVVFDRVESTQADYAKTWLLHTANEPTLLGNEFHAGHGQGHIFCRTLYPLDAVLEKIGGPHKEFWADGRNWPVADWWLTPGSGDWWKRAGRGHTEPPAAMGRWRVEVKPGHARRDDCFLHMIQASDQETVKLVPSQLHETAQRLEVTFTVNNRVYTISFKKSGEIGCRLRVETAEAILLDRPFEHFATKS